MLESSGQNCLVCCVELADQTGQMPQVDGAGRGDYLDGPTQISKLVGWQKKGHLDRVDVEAEKSQMLAWAEFGLLDVDGEA